MLMVVYHMMSCMHDALEGVVQYVTLYNGLSLCTQPHTTSLVARFKWSVFEGGLQPCKDMTNHHINTCGVCQLGVLAWHKLKQN